MIKKQNDIQLLPKNSPRYRITATLLNSWQYIFDAKDDVFESENDTMSYEDKLAAETEKRYNDFLNTLNRIPFDNPYMERGRIFEKTVCDGNDPVFSPYVKNGAFQVTVTKDVDIDGVPITLYGVLDVLKKGRIMDLKRVSKYKYGKYKTSHQHPMYMFLVPEAIDFTYLVADNNIDSLKEETRAKGYHLEHYLPVNCENILDVCSQFISWLKSKGLYEIWTEKWQMKY